RTDPPVSPGTPPPSSPPPHPMELVVRAAIPRAASERASRLHIFMSETPPQGESGTTAGRAPWPRPLYQGGSLPRQGGSSQLGDRHQARSAALGDDRRSVFRGCAQPPLDAK